MVYIWKYFCAVLIVLFLSIPASASSEVECESVDRKPVKIEAWMSKRYEKNFRSIRRDFAAMGDTRVALWVYPYENPSQIVAIGRCVPAYIARHSLQKAMEYTGGVSGLVHQGFVSSHWIGVGTSLFAENSLQPISADQLNQLMDESLDTDEFQQLYRSFTVQDEKVKAFGLMLDNPKMLKDFNRRYYPSQN